MKPQEPHQQPKSSTSQNSETDSKSHSSKTDSTWNDRDKSSSLTPKDLSAASTKQYEDIKPRDSKFNATDIEKSSRKLDEDMKFNRDDTRQEKGPRYDQNVNRNSDRKI
jgi:hypothetical protein